MEFPTEFSTGKVTVQLNSKVLMSNPWFEMNNPIALSATLPSGGSEWSAQGANDSGFTKEQALDALVEGFKAAAQYLATVTGRDDVFLREDAIQVIFEGVASESTPVSTEEEEV